jgi:hypothetical protein
MVLLLVGAMFLASCARHDDLPPTLAFVEAPAPSSPVATTSDQIVYDLSWSISEPSAVAYYNIYMFIPFLPALVDSTTLTSVQVDFQTLVPQVDFGVTAVSVDNIESRIVFASQP